ncbi:MAG: phage major capsid protein [Mycobacterium sp.]|nr:MAG: phage major capsid protein [Mycobacterium sp.]
MFSARLQQLKEQAEAEVAKARKITETAEAAKRDMTEAEKADYAAAVKAGLGIVEAIKNAKADQEVLDQARKLADEIGGVGGEPHRVAKDGRAVGQRLSFKGMGAATAAKMAPAGVKALAPSGATVVPQVLSDDPVALGRVATGLLDVLPLVVQSSPEYAYLRQKTRTNNAAVVAEGAVKPTSVFGVEKIEQSLDVVAHLSEGVPRYWLLDNGMLESFVSDELQYGLGLAVEDKVFADINATSGIQAQAYSTSVLETLRKAITRLENVGLVASAIALTPGDWETVELALSSTNAVEHLSLPYDPATRRLFGVPIATTTSQTAGIGHVLAQESVVVDTDSNGIGVQWSESSNADDFSKNLIRARCEGRFGTSVLRPLGVVKADLTSS